MTLNEITIMVLGLFFRVSCFSWDNRRDRQIIQAINFAIPSTIWFQELS